MWPMSLWDADLEGLAGQQPYDRFHGIGRLVHANDTDGYGDNGEHWFCTERRRALDRAGATESLFAAAINRLLQ